MADKFTPQKRAGEFDLIARYFAPLAHNGAFNLKDDAALIAPRDGYQWVITQDTLIEGVHFFADDPPQKIAQKAIRVNVSDIIAKGADPKFYSLSLALPDYCGEKFVNEFSQGLATDQEKFGLALTGGDTVRSPSGLHISITMLGEVVADDYVSRLGARTGDMIVVSGTIGDAQLGLELRLGKPIATGLDKDYLLDRQILPQPPFGIQPIIRKFAHASMDVSDGLIGDLRKLCEASKVSARVHLETVRLSQAAQNCLDEISDEQRKARLISMVCGGDDYQCLFTIDPDDWQSAQELAQATGLTLTHIGDIGAQGDCLLEVLLAGVSVSIENESYSHF